MQTLNLLKNSCKAVENFLKNKPINTVTEIKITRLCNQKCRQCNIYEKSTTPKNLTLQDFKKISRNLQKYGSFVGFISGGEPLLNPDLPEILLHSKKIFPLSVSLVSGLYFDYKKISKIVNLCVNENINIQTSLDGLDELGDYLRGVKNHSKTVLENMEKIANQKEQIGSKSFLYANCVLSAANLSQIPKIINACKNAGWKVTIGLYHHITETTKADDNLKIRNENKFLETVEFLKNNPNILNLDSFIDGLPRILEENFPDFCPFVDGKRTSTRLTIMENADLHLCFGEKIGNLLEDDLQTIFESKFYKQRLAQYRECKGCWSSCYTQKYLLFHPKNPKQTIYNFKKLLNLKVAAK